MLDLILASASSRRQELLDQIGVKYQAAAMDIDESVHEDEKPGDYVERLAKEKALAALASYPDHVVLAADTTVVLDDHILGKPATQEEAISMLKRLSGSHHYVLSGIAVAKLVDGQTTVEAQVVETSVSFLKLSEAQIIQYVQTGEPMDKAGAYGIQGKAAVFVEGIEGSYSNVVGLPLAETGKLLEQCDIPIWQV